MKNISLTQLLILTVVSAIFSQNPIVPPGMYIADPEARVWEDGRIYIYGSRDESDEYWCSYKYHVLSSSDLTNWNIVENAFASKGENNQIAYMDHLLFAPDCAYKNGTYYLYYCSPDDEKYTEGVATSKSPYGPFVKGKHIKGTHQIDPAVLVDNDGQAYYYWGQNKVRVAKLKPNMIEIDTTTMKFPLDDDGNTAFHEGSSIRKINDLYYLVFADESRKARPTCLGYAISDNPMGPFEYKGIIIDNAGSDPSVWNNHGSIEEFNGQWYVFYHRSTNNSQKFRKTCIEPITINADGTIDEVEMTSQGVGTAFKAASLIPARRACFLSGDLYIKSLPSTDINTEGLTNISPNDFASFKYIEFTGSEKSITVKTMNSKGGNFEVRIDSPTGELICSIEIEPSKNNTAYDISESIIIPVKGKHAVFLVFKGMHNEMFDLEWFQFNRENSSRLCLGV